MLTGYRSPYGDTMHGTPATARVHGVQLRDKGYTPVGTEAMTKVEYEAMRELVEAA